MLKDRKEGLKVLLINPFGIGDVLFSTPLIAALKEGLPGVSISYICNKKAYGVIEKCPELDAVYIFEKDDYKRLWKESKGRFIKEFASFIRHIARGRFDIAIDMSMGHQYGFLTKLVNIPKRVGFDYKGRGRFFTERLPFDGFNDKPIAEYYLDLLGLIGLDAGAARPTRIWLAPEDEEFAAAFFEREGLGGGAYIIGIAPGGGTSFGDRHIMFKRYPAAKFASIADALIKEAGAKVVLLWGPGEEGLVEEIKRLMEERPIVAPATTIRQSAAVMAHCGCVVCNDGGPLHVAVAAGARTVSVFGPSDENVYGPYPKSGRHITITGREGCRPCYRKFRLPDCGTLECLRGLDAREVLDAIQRCPSEV